MKRRDFLARSFAFSGAVAAHAVRPSFAAVGHGTSARVRVDSTRLMVAIPSSFMGLGYEISSVAQPGVLSPANHAYVALVRTLGHAGVIRIGGNTSDNARYSPDAPAVSKPIGTVVNDAVLRDLGGFLRATGWKLIWGLNLGSGTEANAMDEAGAVLRFADQNLLAFEIGNEPDLFPNSGHRAPGYRYEEWLAEFRRYKTALRARFPRVPLAGPDAAGHTDWVTRFAADEGKDVSLLTHHYYREGQRNPASTIGTLLAPDPKLQPELNTLRAASQSAGIPYRICEVNSFSGGGRPGVSDTFASALWALDFMYTLAANGCSGVNMETGVNQLGFVSSYSPIAENAHGQYAARPEYYGMLAFALGGKGRLVQTQVDGGSPLLKAYATRQDSGELALTLINKGSDAAEITAEIAGSSRAAEGVVVRLRGPALAAQTAVTLGGSEVSAAGRWSPAQRETVPVRDGKLVIGLAAASAAVVTL